MFIFGKNFNNKNNLTYAIKKKNNEEYILIIFNPMTRGLYISKSDSDILVATNPYLTASFESKVGGAKTLLIPECENIMHCNVEAQKTEKNPTVSMYSLTPMKQV